MRTVYRSRGTTKGLLPVTVIVLAIISCNAAEGELQIPKLARLATDINSVDSSCSHKYIQHLENFPNCSPYIGGVMKVQCVVEVPLNAADITIGWFMDCKQLSNDSNISIESEVQVAAEVRRIRSRLTINGITDDYAGKYTCNMLGDEEYVPGDQLELGDSEELELESSLGQCLDGALFPGAIPAPQKCAVITEDNPVPMSRSCEAPPTSTSTPVISLSSSLSSSIPTIGMHHSTVLLSPSPTTSRPTSTDPQDNNIEFTSPDSLNTVSLSLIAVNSLLTIYILE